MVKCITTTNESNILFSELSMVTRQPALLVPQFAKIFTLVIWSQALNISTSLIGSYLICNFYINTPHALQVSPSFEYACVNRTNLPNMYVNSHLKAQVFPNS